jgi:polyketide synthase PksJ
MTLASALAHAASRKESYITFIRSSQEEEKLSYSDLYHSALRLLGYLQAKGISPGNEVVVQVDDNKLLLLIFWACILGKIIPIPLSPGTQPGQKNKLGTIWKNLSKPYYIGDDEIIIREMMDFTVPGNIAEISGDDIAYVQFSSGSTGDPKGIILTHDNLLSNISDILVSLAIDDRDILLSWMPLTHDMGMIGFHLAAIVCNIPAINLSTSLFVRRPMLWMEKAAIHKATVLYSPNFGLHYYLSSLSERNVLDHDLSAIRILVNGAESISVDLCRAFTAKLGPSGLRSHVIVAAYGLAEASVEVSAMPVNSELRYYSLDRRSLNIGDPVRIVSEDDEKAVRFTDVGSTVPHCRVRISDDKDNLLPDSTIGHIQITGKNVTGGIYNNPEATKKLFTADRWLRTGDIGFLRNGRLVVTGRYKNIIVINGQNYYPADIEQLLVMNKLAEPGKIVVCGIKNFSEEKEQLIVFVLCKNPGDEFHEQAAAIRETIGREVGIYADAVIPIRRIPKTTSGKTQYFVLAEQYREGLFREIEQRFSQRVERNAVAGKEELIERLVAICRDYIGLNIITPSMNFFNAGMNSLAAMQLCYYVQQETGIGISVRDIFENTDILRLSDYIFTATSGNGKTTKTTRIEPVADAPHYAVSFGQRRLLLMDGMEQGLCAYNEFETYSLDEEVDPLTVEMAFAAIAERHETLRTNFIRIDDDFCQVVHEKGARKPECRFFNLSGNEDAKEEMQRMIRRFSLIPFDLSRDPLYRVVLFKTGKSRFFLSFFTHHIISDFYSEQLLVKEFETCYNACKTGTGDFPAPLPIQYRDYSLWANARLGQKEFSVGRQYWLDMFSGEIPVLKLPTDYPRAQKSTMTAELLHVEIPPSLFDSLIYFGGRQNSTPFMMVMCAVYILYSKYSGQDDIVIGVPFSDRTDPQSNELIGFFVNTLPLRLTFDPEDSLADVLAKVKKLCLEAYSHRFVPMDLILNELPHPRDLSRSPLFDVLVSFNETSPGRSDSPERPALLKKTDKQFSNGKYDISLYFNWNPDKPSFSIEYNSSLFKKPRINRMAGHLLNILGAVVKADNTPVSLLDCMTASEKSWLMNGINQGVTTGHPGTVSDLFRMQVKASPSAVAVVCAGRSLTYEQLDEQSDLLAAYLINQCQIAIDDTVGLLLNRSEYMIIAILGIWKAGAAYVPIDPDFPADRIAYILNETRVSVLLTDRSTPHRLDRTESDNGGLPLILLIEVALAAKSQASFASGDIGELAYVMYTSGSTGKPKGVEVYRKSVLNVLLWLQSEMKVTSHDSYLSVSAYIFDISVAEFFLPLVSGARLILATKAQISDIDLLKGLIAVSKPTIMQATPSLWNILVDNNWNGDPSIRIVSCGEALTDKLKLRLLDLVGALWNMYGPTETAIFSTACRVPYSNNAVTIGKPIDNTVIYILDKNGQPAVTGVYGELYIGGMGVAKGYRNRPALTLEQFVPDPFLNGGILYRTGDRGRWTDTGEIQLLGRLDSQVKLRGFRIELSEIEQVILDYPDVSSAAVLLKKNMLGQDVLVAYLAYRNDKQNRLNGLKGYMALKLPPYMMPAHYIQLGTFPVNESFKIDKRLLALEELHILPAGEREKEMPKTPVQEELQKIWEQVFDIKDIGISDNFFDLGGHSLKANSLVNKIYKEMGIKVNITEIFSHPSIRELSLMLEETRHESFKFIDLD